METGLVKAFLLNRYHFSTANVNGFQVCLGRCHVNKCYYFSSSQKPNFSFSIVTVLSNSSINWKIKKSLHGVSAHTPDLQISRRKNLCGIMIKGTTVIKTRVILYRAAVTYFVFGNLWDLSGHLMLKNKGNASSQSYILLFWVKHRVN